jgi:hypothetical protein
MQLHANFDRSTYVCLTSFNAAHQGLQCKDSSILHTDLIVLKKSVPSSLGFESMFSAQFHYGLPVMWNACMHGES